MAQPKLQKRILDSFIEKLKADEAVKDDLVERLRVLLASESKVKAADLIAVFAAEEELE